MATCQHCGAFVSLPFKCNYCGGEFCPSCRLPPDHNCAGIGSWKNTSAPHASAKMDRIHYPELWGTIRPESRSLDDERSDPRFYPPGGPPEFFRENWFWILVLCIVAYLYLF